MLQIQFGQIGHSYFVTVSDLLFIGKFGKRGSISQIQLRSNTVLYSFTIVKYCNIVTMEVSEEGEV